MSIDTIFLDYQASTPLDTSVYLAMQPYLTEYYANPHSSDHILGWQSQQAIESARHSIANAINADTDEIIFTSGATESNNLAIKGLMKYLKKQGKTTIITSAIEHKCVISSFEYLSNEGFDVIELPATHDGFILPERLESVMTESVGLVSVMLVNNEIGTIQAVEELAYISHKYNAIFHTDAAQAPVFMNLDVRKYDVDLLSLSSHKVYGPKGVGALFIKRDKKQFMEPIMHGGGQEGGIRSGTLPTPLCVGFGKAVEFMASTYDQNYSKLSTLSETFLVELSNVVPEISVNGATINRHPGNLNIRFHGFDSKDLLQFLQPKIAASTGSACSTGVEEPSYVLTAIGLSLQEASESVRFSFGLDQNNDLMREAARFIGDKIKERNSIMNGNT